MSFLSPCFTWYVAMKKWKHRKFILAVCFAFLQSVLFAVALIGCETLRAEVAGFGLFCIVWFLLFIHRALGERLTGCTFRQTVQGLAATGFTSVGYTLCVITIMRQLDIMKWIPICIMVFLTSGFLHYRVFYRVERIRNKCWSLEE